LKSFTVERAEVPCKVFCCEHLVLGTPWCGGGAVDVRNSRAFRARKLVNIILQAGVVVATSMTLSALPEVFTPRSPRSSTTPWKPPARPQGPPVAAAEQL